MAKFSGLESVGIFGQKDIGKISFINNRTGNEDLYIDYANTAEFSLSSEAVYARGNSQNMVSFDQSKEGSGTISCEISSVYQLALANGSPIEEKARQYYIREEFTMKKEGDKAELKEKPANGTVKFYKVGSDKRTKLPLATQPTIQDKTVTFTGSKAGETYVVAYMSERQGIGFTIKAINETSDSYTMIIHSRVKTHVEGSYVNAEVRFPNVTMRSEGTMIFDAENVSTFDIAIDILADKNGDMCTWSLIPDLVTTPVPTPAVEGQGQKEPQA